MFAKAGLVLVAYAFIHVQVADVILSICNFFMYFLLLNTVGKRVTKQRFLTVADGHSQQNLQSVQVKGQ